MSGVPAAHWAAEFLAFKQQIRNYVANKRAVFAVSMQIRCKDAILTPEPCKLARAGLGISDLAERAQVSTNTVSRFEAGEELKSRTVAALQAALEAAGVIVIEHNGEGPGVRLRKSEGTN